MHKSGNDIQAKSLDLDRNMLHTGLGSPLWKNKSFNRKREKRQGGSGRLNENERGDERNGAGYTPYDECVCE